MEHAEPDRLEDLIHELDRLQRRFEALDGYGLEAKIEKILPDLGFATGDSDRFVSEFSGGWQMRMSLGKILLQAPDLLLLGNSNLFPIPYSLFPVPHSLNSKLKTQNYYHASSRSYF